jgi:ribosomal protein S27E
MRGNHKMPAKNTYEYIKQYIESVTDYKLLSKKYINSKEKLTIQCSKNHTYNVTFNNFQHGFRCPSCGGTKKLTYTQIKNHIESIKGYKLLSVKYINARSKLEIQCPKNHIYKTKYFLFQQGCRCPICFGTPKHTYEYIKNYIESFSYSLLGDNYYGNKEKLTIQCPKNHIFEMKFNSFQSGKQRCPICAKSCITSKGEKEVLNYIQSIYSGKIIENDRTQIVNPKTGCNLELDIWMPELNKAIEYNGEYWHSFSDAVIIDNIKSEQCKKSNIKLLIVNEQNWLKNKKLSISKLDEFIQN